MLQRVAGRLGKLTTVSLAEISEGGQESDGYDHDVGNETLHDHHDEVSARSDVQRQQHCDDGDAQHGPSLPPDMTVLFDDDSEDSDNDTDAVTRTGTRVSVCVSVGWQHELT